MSHSCCHRGKSLKFTTVKQNTSSGQGRTAILAFNATYDNSAVTLTITMKKYSDQWRVIGCNYKTPFFEKFLTCSECETLHQSFVKYCSNCGSLMPAEKPDEEH